MKNKAVHRTPDLDPSVVEKILARHEGDEHEDLEPF